MRRAVSFLHASHDRGAAAIITALLLVPLIMVLAVVVDGGRYLVTRQRAEDAAEAAASLAASNWQAGTTTSSRCASSAMADLVVADAGPGATVACAWRSSGSGGRFDVTVTQQVDLLIASLLRRGAQQVTTTAAAQVGQAAAAGGLRPLGLCISHPAVPPPPSSGGGGSGGGGKKGTTTTVTAGTYGTKVRIAIDADDGRCGSASGNWGVLDLNGGSQSNSETQDWIANGYPGVVSGTVGGSPGIPSGSLTLDAVVDPSASNRARLLTVPLYRTVAGGGGSNATFDVVSFISLWVTGYKLSGSGRYVEVVFTSSGRTLPGTTGIDATLYRGVNAWRVCALDGTSACP